VYICHCRAVTDRRICEAIEAGASDAETVSRHCGAGGACGGCLPAVRALLAHYGLADQARADADFAAA
jgi:bacterioferritin-associated ferredoxin